MNKYELTEEHKAQLKPWADKWSANAMNTKPMDDTEKALCREHVKGLYRAAYLTPPPDHRIVFVSSPFVLRFAGGFAAAIWHLRKPGVRVAYAATDAATCDATYAATRDATDDATSASGDKSKWYRWSLPSMVQISKSLGLAEFGIRCAQSAWHMWQGGNQWSAWVGFLSFFRHVAKLSIDYSKWDHYEKLAELSGPRIMHEKFCMISDRPRVLKVNARNQPHCDTGPFCQWSDGAAIYALNGVRVPAWLVETPADQIDPKSILTETNAQVRSEIVKKVGIQRILTALGSETIDTWNDYELILLNMQDGRHRPYLKMKNPSVNLVHVEGVPPEIKTVKQALAWRNGLEVFTAPQILT